MRWDALRRGGTYADNGTELYSFCQQLANCLLRDSKMQAIRQYPKVMASIMDTQAWICVQSGLTREVCRHKQERLGQIMDEFVFCHLDYNAMNRRRAILETSATCRGQVVERPKGEDGTELDASSLSMPEMISISPRRLQPPPAAEPGRKSMQARLQLETTVGMSNTSAAEGPTCDNEANIETKGETVQSVENLKIMTQSFAHWRLQFGIGLDALRKRCFCNVYDIGKDTQIIYCGVCRPDMVRKRSTTLGLLC